MAGAADSKLYPTTTSVSLRDLGSAVVDGCPARPPLVRRSRHGSPHDAAIQGIRLHVLGVRLRTESRPDRDEPPLRKRQRRREERLPAPRSDDLTVRLTAGARADA